MTSVHLTPGELDTVRAVLRNTLPPGTRVYVFGSRATGKPKPWSDLDLAIDGGGPLPHSLVADLREAFDESDFRWKVDLLDYAALSPEFARIVDAAKVPFPL